MHQLLAVLLSIPFVLVSTVAHAVSEANPPRVLASGVNEAGLLADGKLLCCTFDGSFFTLDPLTGETSTWSPAWKPETDGWTDTGAAGFNWRMRISPDGKYVALATGVGVARHSTEGDFTDYTVAIVLCSPDGNDARCVALAENTDGGPSLDFSQDCKRLFGPWFFPCEATAAGFQRYIDADYTTPGNLQCNYIDTATGSRSYDPGSTDYEFYLKSPYSDYFVYGGLEEPGYGFSSFSQRDEDFAFINDWDNSWSYYEWVLPDALLVSLSDGNQQLVYVAGKTKTAPQPVWRCFTCLPDGMCMFSDDNGTSVKYGKVDWPTFTVDWWVDRPDLARFAEPRGEDGWPARLNQWIPLRDGSGVVIVTPAEGDVVMVKLSREGAKP